MIIRTLKCDECGVEQAESAATDASWFCLERVNLCGGNAHLCPQCAPVQAAKKLVVMHVRAPDRDS